MVEQRGEWPVYSEEIKAEKGKVTRPGSFTFSKLEQSLQTFR